MHHADVVDVERTPCVPQVLAFANTWAGYTQWFTMLMEATAQAVLAEPLRSAQGPSLPRAGSQALLRQGAAGDHPGGPQTDPVDARLITEILPREHVPISHVPEATTVQGLRDLPRLRADLVGQVGDVKRRLISILDRTFPEFATYFSDVCGQAARTLLETWTLPEQLAAGPTARLVALWARLSHGHFGTEKARAVKEATPQSIGVQRAADALAFEWRLLLR